jgi:hypothetical protein
LRQELIQVGGRAVANEESFGMPREGREGKRETMKRRSCLLMMMKTYCHEGFVFFIEM